MALHLLLLLIPFEGCTSGPPFETQTVAIGENVSLQCPRDSARIESLFWIRLVSGAFPEFLVRISSSDFPKSLNGESSGTGRITARQEPGLFVLHIPRARKSDMALYYCLRSTWSNNITFLNGIFLQVRDFPERKPSVFAVTQNMLSDDSRPRPSVPARCSVHFRSENDSCTDGHRVYWFSDGTENAIPNFIYAYKECGKLENGSVQKCVGAFSKKVNSSDAATYSCAVAACGQIFMGSARDVNIKDASGCDLQMLASFALGAALALIWIMSAFLIYKIKTKSCFYCQACQRSRDQTPSQTQQRNEDSMVYTAPTILTRKSGKASPTSTRTVEDFSTYTDVCLRDSKRDRIDETA